MTSPAMQKRGDVDVEVCDEASERAIQVHLGGEEVGQACIAAYAVAASCTTSVAVGSRLVLAESAVGPQGGLAGVARRV